MSWDIVILDFPPDAVTVADLSGRDFKPGPLGPRNDLIARIREILPEADFKNPSWGVLDSEDFSIEFNMGRKETCDMISLYVRGGGHTAMVIVAKLLQHLKLRGIDCQTSEFFRYDAAEESFRKWQKYRDQVVQRKDSNASS